ncbi:shikimate dehydrogenase [Anaerobium acetethylicum]|uniref:Shikimate dehydrogenase (NADP(+)) n=1 Tax=Anaerobium acetethylicum TaxID=1619234 RepID=A0A1D3TVA9_9FIRM|nr:shikimate dehydrogenase [Anaerobium acetethylicum]SCP98077.1 shikimate dehydrogenase [Anaerobium acetethylicum]
MIDQINGMTRTCGLIGNPVEHTLSPVIHNSLASRTGINLVYVPFHVEEGGLENAVKGAYDLNILGMNVTVPYKTKVMEYLAEIDDDARRIGAVNTLVRVPGGYKGYNTDLSGLYRGMVSDGIRIEGETVIILGAGGAGKAVASLCAAKGAKKIYILNRSLDKAEELACSINREFGRDIVIALGISEYGRIEEDSCLAIQTTSVGLHPDVDVSPVDDRDFFEKIHTGIDIIYKPAETKFMKLVKVHGGNAYNGLKMLLYQGIIAYELWNRVEVDENTAGWIYSLLKEELGINE